MIFRPQPNIDPLTIIKMIQAQPRVYALDGQDKLQVEDAAGRDGGAVAGGE